jgi:hypothetical protein
LTSLILRNQQTPNTHKKIPFVIVSAATLFSGGFFYFNNSSAQTASQTQPVQQQANRAVHPANPRSSGTATPSSLAAHRHADDQAEEVKSLLDT